MNADELVQAGKVLGWISEQLKNLPEKRDAATPAGLICSAASLIVLHMALHMTNGEDPYDALIRAAESPDAESQVKLREMLTLALARMPKE